MHVFGIWLSFSSFLSEVISMSCGIDNSPVTHVYEGVTGMETYPWLGVLYYPHNKKRYTTSVVLVTRQIVLATAPEIDKLPKYDFRSRARVILGQNCSGHGVGIRDYVYHPDYTKNTYSTIAIIQLETDHVKTVLRPICPPPVASHYQDLPFFAMILSEVCFSMHGTTEFRTFGVHGAKANTSYCKRSKVRIYKMTYVSPEECKTFYRRAELDLDTMWPSHTACARSVRGGRCVWRSGAILVVKWGLRWRLLGFGVYGPGCQAPARFLDYGMYHEWVQRSVERIGKPAITNLAENHVIMRRTLSNVQRFGYCDKEEQKRALFTESTIVGSKREGVARYNLTIIGNMDYTCIILKADYENHIVSETPRLRLRKWCAGQISTMCSGFQFIEIHFYVEIEFTHKLNYRVLAYGESPRIIAPELGHKHANLIIEYPIPLIHWVYKSKMRPFVIDSKYPLYGKKNMTSKKYSKFPPPW